MKDWKLEAEAERSVGLDNGHLDRGRYLSARRGSPAYTRNVGEDLGLKTSSCCAAPLQLKSVCHRDGGHFHIVVCRKCRRTFDRGDRADLLKAWGKQ